MYTLPKCSVAFFPSQTFGTGECICFSDGAVITFGGNGRQVNWHTLQYAVLGHFNDCTCVTVSEAAVPGFNVWYSGKESQLCDGCFGVGNGSFCGEYVEAFPR